MGLSGGKGVLEIRAFKGCKWLSSVGLVKDILVYTYRDNALVAHPTHGWSRVTCSAVCCLILEKARSFQTTKIKILKTFYTHYTIPLGWKNGLSPYVFNVFFSEYRCIVIRDDVFRAKVVEPYFFPSQTFFLRLIFASKSSFFSTWKLETENFLLQRKPHPTPAKDRKSFGSSIVDPVLKAA